MGFLRKSAAAAAILGITVLAAAMVVDMMENEVFWHRVKPQEGN